MGVIWGIPYLFIKIAVSELSPSSLVFLRTAIGAGLLLPIAFARKDLGPLLRHWKWIVAYTFVEVAAPWFFLSDAERRISSSLSGLLIALVPSIGAILAWATGADERVDLRRVAGLGPGLLGVAALVGLDVGARDRHHVRQAGRRARARRRIPRRAAHDRDRSRLRAHRPRFRARNTTYRAGEGVSRAFALARSPLTAGRTTDYVRDSSICRTGETTRPIDANATAYAPATTNAPAGPIDPTSAAAASGPIGLMRE